MPHSVNQIIIDGKPYISSTSAGSILGVSAKTVLRWLQLQSRKNCPDLVRLLQFTKDPITGYTFLLLSSVEEVARRRRMVRRPR
jgi:hypothetical protein